MEGAYVKSLRDRVLLERRVELVADKKCKMSGCGWCDDGCCCIGIFRTTPERQVKVASQGSCREKDVPSQQHPSHQSYHMHETQK